MFQSAIAAFERSNMIGSSSFGSIFGPNREKDWRCGRHQARDGLTFYRLLKTSVSSLMNTLEV